MNERKKLLLFGANQSLLNDFFAQQQDLFEMLSCSGRIEDIRGHLKYYDPDALVLCLYDEKREELSMLGRVKELLKQRGSVLIVAGDGIKCDDFERMMPRMADLIVRRGRINNCQVMGDQIDAYLDTMAIFRKIKKEEEELDDSSFISSPVSSFGGDPVSDPVSNPVSSFAGTVDGNDSLESLLAAAAEAVKEMEAMPPAERIPGERRHVLVVDDDSSMLRMIKDILGDKYDVAAAISGKVALKFLETRRTDLILLDYEMPEQSGAEVYEKILQNPGLRHIPVVFLTGVSDRERIATVLAMRPRGYLLKPIDSERLKKTVEEIVG